MLKLKATAKTPGPCCLKGCTLPGDQIYEGDGLRLLACTEGHAKATLTKIQAVVKRHNATREQRDAALWLMNVAPIADDQGEEWSDADFL